MQKNRLLRKLPEACKNVSESWSIFARMNELPEKSNKRFILVCVGLAAFALIAVAGTLVFRSRVAPLLTARRSVINLNNEILQRINATPLQAVGMLFNSLENGTIEAEYRASGLFGMRVNGTLSSNAQTRMRSLEAHASIMALLGLDIEARITPQHTAFSSNMLGNDFFGFTYNTFRYDISAFGLDATTANLLSDLVESMEATLNAETHMAESFQNYRNVIMQFIRSVSFTATRSSTRVSQSGGNTINIEFHIPRYSLYTLINALYTLLKNDDHLLTWLTMLSNTGSFFDNFDTFDISTMRDLVLELEQLGDTSNVLLIDNSNNRLMNINLHFNDIETGITGIKIDFGQSVYCRWGGYVYSIYDAEVKIKNLFWWDFNNGNIYTNVLSLHAANTSPRLLTSEWAPLTGLFTLNDTSAANPLTGTFTIDSNGSFVMRLNQPNILISATQEAPIIQDVEFININMWDNNLINQIQNIQEILSLLGL